MIYVHFARGGDEIKSTPLVQTNLAAALCETKYGGLSAFNSDILWYSILILRFNVVKAQVPSMEKGYYDNYNLIQHQNVEKRE